MSVESSILLLLSVDRHLGLSVVLEWIEQKKSDPFYSPSLCLSIKCSTRNL